MYVLRFNKFSLRWKEKYQQLIIKDSTKIRILEEKIDCGEQSMHAKMKRHRYYEEKYFIMKFMMLFTNTHLKFIRFMQYYFN